MKSVYLKSEKKNWGRLKMRSNTAIIIQKKLPTLELNNSPSKYSYERFKDDFNKLFNEINLYGLNKVKYNKFKFKFKIN